MSNVKKCGFSLSDEHKIFSFFPTICDKLLCTLCPIQYVASHALLENYLFGKDKDFFQVCSFIFLKMDSTQISKYH